MLIDDTLGEMPPTPTEVISPRPGKAGRMEDSVDQFHLILWFRKPKPAIKNDMPSGFWFTNMVMNIGAELGLEASMSPQRRSVTVRSGFVWVGVLALILKIYSLILCLIFSQVWGNPSKCFLLVERNVKMDGRREERRKKKKKGSWPLVLPGLSVPHFTCSAFSMAPFANQLSVSPTAMKARWHGFAFWKPSRARPSWACSNAQDWFFFGFQLWQLSHPHPKGQVRTHPWVWVNGKKLSHSRGGSQVEEFPERFGAPWPLPRGASHGRARVAGPRGPCGAGVRGSAGARAHPRGRGPRARARARALGVVAGRRAGRQGRGRGGARTPRRAGLLRGCSAATSRRPLAAAPRA